jgi:hypothetical protein
MPEQGGAVRLERRAAARLTLALNCSWSLPGIAPNDLSDADQRKNRAVDRPMKVPDHETDAERQIEALENPNGAHANHRNADEAAGKPHHNIE